MLAYFAFRGAKCIVRYINSWRTCIVSDIRAFAFDSDFAIRLSDLFRGPCPSAELLILIPHAKRNPPIPQLANIRQIHRQAAAQHRSARRRRVWRERIIRDARIRHRSQIDHRPIRTIDAVRLFQLRPIIHNPPNEQSLGGQTLIEAELAAVFQEEIFAAVGADQDFHAFARPSLHRREDDLLLYRRIDDGGFDPAELLLAPGGEMLWASAAGLHAHAAPGACPGRAGEFGAGVQVGQAEHVAELMTEQAGRRHVGAALGADEVVPFNSLVLEEGFVRPIQSAAGDYFWAVAGVDKQDAVVD